MRSFVRIRHLMTFVVLCSLCCVKTLTAHDHHSHPAPPSKVPPERIYQPSAVPDRIMLTLTASPATSQAITWRTDATVVHALLEFAVAEDGPAFVDRTESHVAKTESLESNLSTAHYHSVVLTDLAAKTKYVYRVGDGENWSEWAHFTTASETAEPFSFVYFGDAQNDVKAHWSRVVREAYQDAPRAAFLLHAGDLVNRADEDAEWGEWFYSQGFIPRTTPCIAVPGNHEQSKLTDEATGEVSRSLTKHWERVFEFPANGPEGSQEAVYWVDYQGARFIGLNSNEKFVEQAEWLKQVLEQNPHPWTIVTFHHPIYSSKSGRDNRELRDLLQPIFDQYRVDLVLNGHDHTYARTKMMTYGEEQNVPTGVRTQDKTGGTVYVVSVSGPKMYELGREPMMQRVAEDTQLYQIITIDGQELRYEARTATGKPYDAFTLKKREGQPNELVEQIPNTPERTRGESAAKQSVILRRESDNMPLAEPSLVLMNPEAKDQDDLCVWRDHQSPERSLIITSDKAANKIFVYDLTGKLLQSVEVPKPGNIDLRYQIRLDDQRADIVAVNQRTDGFKLRLFRIDPQDRRLIPIDQGGIATGPNYGGCLYHARQTDRLYFFTTSKDSGVEQIELQADGQGHLIGTKVRHIEVGKSEGAVANDQLGVVYIAEEEKGVWKFAADPKSDDEGELILKVGENEILGDLEGLALTTSSNQIQFLTVSDQGTSTFHVLPLTGTRNTYRFAVQGAQSTDGLEVVNQSFGEAFPDGFFACHSDSESGCPVLVVPLQRVLAALGLN